MRAGRCHDRYVSKAWGKGSTRAGRKVRARVLLRDGYRCQLAYAGEWITADGQARHCMGAADCVHHTRGKGVTGDDPAHMVAACTPCNLRAGEPDPATDPPPRPMTRW